MSYRSVLVVIACLSIAFSGCGTTEQDPVHDASDIIWRHTNIRPTVNGKKEFGISFGSHGFHYHSGDTIEPAVAVTKDGEDFSTAKCFVKLAVLDPKDASKIIREVPGELKMTFVPKTAAKPAHYAQAELLIPTDAKQCMVIYRVELESGATVARQIIISLGH